jgi:hypothetical protein
MRAKLPLSFCTLLSPIFSRRSFFAVQMGSTPHFQLRACSDRGFWTPACQYPLVICLQTPIVHVAMIEKVPASNVKLANLHRLRLQ